MKRALKNLLVQGTFDGSPTGGTLDLSLCTVFLPASTSSGDYKQSVRVATTANGTISTAFANGQTVDGITLSTGDRILLKDQSSQAANGIYVVAASGSPARASDFDSWLELPGAVVAVEQGTVNAGTQWVCNVAAGGTLGSTAITFTVPKNYLDLTSNQSVAGVKTFGSVVLTTADINGGTIDGTTIGGTTPAAGIFTTIGGTLVSSAVNSCAIDSNSTIGGVQVSNGLGGNSAGSQIILPENSTIFALYGGSLTTILRATAATDVTLPESGTLLSDNDIGLSVQAYDADLTTWAGITPGANVGTFLATPSSANLAAAITGETGSGALVFGTSPTFTTSILIPDGTAGVPGIQFSADTDCGVYRLGNNNFGFATAGILRWHISATGQLFAGAGNYDYNIGASLFKGSSGSASAPTFTFGSTGDENTGMYRISEDQIGFTAGGTLRFTINTAGIYAAGTLSVTGASTLTGNVTQAGAQIYTPQALSGAGAVNITTTSTAFTATAPADALTLADGTAGQIKIVCMVATSGGGTGVLTPTTKSGYTTITFNAAGDAVTLQFFTTAGWCIIGSRGVAIA